MAGVPPPTGNTDQQGSRGLHGLTAFSAFQPNGPARSTGSAPYAAGWATKRVASPKT